MFSYIKNHWETKEHKKIRIEDMETSHIKNVIRFLKNNLDFYDDGGGYPWDIDSMWYEDNSELVYKKIGELEEELNRRGIK